MNISACSLPGLLLLQPRVFGDARGYFLESFREELSAQGLALPRQVNLSRSSAGVLRGLHYQVEQPQAKLLTVVRGRIFDVAVDLRPGSPSFGRWHGEELSDENHTHIYIPEGFAHGFCALSEEVDLLYYCSDYYNPQAEVGLLWNDPDLAIDWPVTSPLVSEKDACNYTLATLPADRFPR